MVVNLYNFTNKQTPMVKNIKKCIYRILLDYLTDLYYKVWKSRDISTFYLCYKKSIFPLICRQ